jgi:hypothetical protein
MNITSPIRVFGRHAQILKKYSKDKQAEEKNEFILFDIDGDKQSTYIFDTMIDCALTAMMLGIVEQKEAQEDNDSSITPATIFADIVMKKSNIIQRIFKHMVLSTSEFEAQDKIKLSFGVLEPEEQKDFINKLYAYMRGGLEILDSFFADCSNYEETSRKIYKINSKYFVE